MHKPLSLRLSCLLPKRASRERRPACTTDKSDIGNLKDRGVSGSFRPPLLIGGVLVTANEPSECKVRMMRSSYDLATFIFCCPRKLQDLGGGEPLSGALDVVGSNRAG
jgi:hypothetical protein